MVTYFEKLQEEIDRDVRELNNLNLEKRALYVSRRSWSDENYDREETAINTKIEEIIRRINEKKDLLATYTLVNNYTTDVKALADMYNEETDIKFKDGDVLVFGPETRGLPENYVKQDTAITIPMKEGQRSLNLSNSVAIVAYEAVRQNGLT